MVTLRSLRQCLFVSSWPPMTEFAPLPAPPTRWILVAWLVPALDADTPTAALTARAATVAAPKMRLPLPLITQTSFQGVHRTSSSPVPPNTVEREKSRWSGSQGNCGHPDASSGRENRGWQGRRAAGEGNAPASCVIEPADRGRRQAKVCSVLSGRSWTRTRDLLLIREAL